MSNNSRPGSSSEEEESKYRIRSTPLLSPEPDTSGPSSINQDEEQTVLEPSSEAPASQELVAVEQVTPGSSTESARSASDASVNTDNEGVRVGYSSRYFWFLYNQKLHSVSGSTDGRPKVTISYANGRNGEDSDDSVDLSNDTLYVPADDHSSESHTFESDDDLSVKEKSDDNTEKPSGSTARSVGARHTRRDSSTSQDSSESHSSD